MCRATFEIPPGRSSARAAPLIQLAGARLREERPALSLLFASLLTTKIHHAFEEFRKNSLALRTTRKRHTSSRRYGVFPIWRTTLHFLTMEPPAETNGKATIESTAHIPIAQLTRLLAAPASRSIKAIVTLTWPYSSATGSVAFLLSEPDFRLRRTRGQVRVQFAGSSAKQVAKSGIASGDEVILCLEGVEWVEDENRISTPGRGVEFELKFTERLLLQVRSPRACIGSLLTFDL
jgi:hypothetical protein